MRTGGALAVGPTNPLSQVRKEEVAGIQKAILNGVPMPASKNAISPAPEVLPDTTTILPTYTYNCPSGGTIVVTGSFTETSNSDSMTIVENPKKLQGQWSHVQWRSRHCDLRYRNRQRDDHYSDSDHHGRYQRELFQLLD